MLDYPLCAPRKVLSCIAPTSSVVIVKDVYTIFFLSTPAILKYTNFIWVRLLFL